MVQSVSLGQAWCQAECVVEAACTSWWTRGREGARTRYGPHPQCELLPPVRPHLLKFSEPPAGNQTPYTRSCGIFHVQTITGQRLRGRPFVFYPGPGPSLLLLLWPDIAGLQKCTLCLRSPVQATPQGAHVGTWHGLLSK